MTAPFVVAYYTNDDYAKEAERLRLSLEELCIPHAIKAVKGISGWNEAVRFKPRFIFECMTTFNRDLLYVDADAIFRNVPDWPILEGMDVGVHHFQRSKRHAVELLTGTVYVRNGVETLQFVTEWARLTDNFVGCDTPEQESLRQTVKTFGSLVRLGNLPPSWCFIFDDMRRMYPDTRPVIEHFQASRRYRFKREGKP